jgi:hypothetical protein
MTRANALGRVGGLVRKPSARICVDPNNIDLKAKNGQNTSPTSLF